MTDVTSDDANRELHDDVVSGKAWNDFCDALKIAGEMILERSESDLDRAEGFRFLSRLTRGGLASFVEGGDIRFPIIKPLPDQVKIGSDNPDAAYLACSIDGRLNYKVSGNRGTVHYLSFSAFAGNYGAAQERLGVMGFIDGSDLLVDEEGNFELFVGPTPHDHNWVKTDPEPGMLAIRQFFLDRSTEVLPTLRIECLDHDELPPPLSPTQFGKQLQGAMMFVAGCSQIFTDWADELMTEVPNGMHTKAGPAQGAWGDPNQIFYHGAYDLAEGEALLIEFVPPECYYWNFQVDNRWMESLDYRWLPVTVNKHTAHYEPDGSVKIVVSKEDPGFGNWMSTDGHSQGLTGLRWNQATEDVEPTLTVIRPFD